MSGLWTHNSDDCSMSSWCTKAVYWHNLCWETNCLLNWRKNGHPSPLSLIQLSFSEVMLVFVKLCSAGSIPLLPSCANSGIVIMNGHCYQDTQKPPTSMNWHVPLSGRQESYRPSTSRFIQVPTLSQKVAAQAQSRHSFQIALSYTRVLQQTSTALRLWQSAIALSAGLLLKSTGMCSLVWHFLSPHMRMLYIQNMNISSCLLFMSLRYS